jgi:hypothetical protein
MGCGASTAQRRDCHGDYAGDVHALRNAPELRMYDELGRRSGRSSCISANEPSPLARSIQETYIVTKARFAHGIDSSVEDFDMVKELTSEFNARIATWVAGTVEERPTYDPVLHDSPAMQASGSDVGSLSQETVQSPLSDRYSDRVSDVSGRSRRTVDVTSARKATVRSPVGATKITTSPALRNHYRPPDRSPGRTEAETFDLDR